MSSRNEAGQLKTDRNLSSQIQLPQLEIDDYSRQLQTSNSPTKTCIFIYIVCTFAALSMLALLFQNSQQKLNRSAQVSTTNAFLGQFFTSSNTTEIISFDENCSDGKAFKKEQLNVVCYRDRRGAKIAGMPKYDWAEVLEIQIDIQNQKKMKENLYDMSKYAEHGLIIGWQSSTSYAENKEIFESINAILETKGFQLDQTATDQFQKKLQKWYSNNIKVFIKKTPKQEKQINQKIKEDYMETQYKLEIPEALEKTTMKEETENLISPVQNLDQTNETKNTVDSISVDEKLNETEKSTEKTTQTLNEPEQVKASPQGFESATASIQIDQPSKQATKQSMNRQSTGQENSQNKNLPNKKNQLGDSSSKEGDSLSQDQLKTSQKKQINLKQQKQVKLTVDENGSFDGQGNQLEKQHYFSKNLQSAIEDLYKLKQAKSIVDFGGGLCKYTQNLQKLGYQVECYDGNPYTPEVTSIGKFMDLTLPQNLGKQFDWVQSFEVGQHIPESKSDTYLDILAGHARQGIIMSWAKIGQRGYHHINEKSNAEVIRRVCERGFKLNIELSRKYRQMTENWFQTNILVFERTQTLEQNVNYEQLAELVQIKLYLYLIEDSLIVSNNSLKLSIRTSEPLHFQSEQVFKQNVSISIISVQKPTSIIYELDSTLNKIFHITMVFEDKFLSRYIFFNVQLKIGNSKVNEKFQLKLKSGV